MEQTRNNRVFTDYKAGLRARVGHLMTALRRYQRSRYAPGAGIQIFGGFADYADQRGIRAIIADKTNTEGDEVIAKFSALLPELTEKFAERYKADFVTVARRGLGGRDITIH